MEKKAFLDFFDRNLRNTEMVDESGLRSVERIHSHHLLYAKEMEENFTTAETESFCKFFCTKYSIVCN